MRGKGPFRNVRGFAREGLVCKRGRLLQEMVKNRRRHLDGTKCQMSSGKEQQHESSGNERENEPKIANLPKCKWMQGNAGARANQDLGNKRMPGRRQLPGRGVGRQMPGSTN